MDLPVLVLNPITSHCGTGRLVNISLDGALISSSPNSHIGARIQVCLSATVLDAYMVRTAGPSFAIQWVKFAPTEVVALVRGHVPRIRTHSPA